MDRDKARCTMHVSSASPLRIVRAALTAYGSTPAVLLPGQESHEASRRIAPASTECTVDSLRVRWGPFLRSSRRRGAFALGPCPCVDGVPVRRLLCPLRLSPGASSLREAFPPHSCPTALRIPRGVSRVPPGRRAPNEGDGVVLLAPSALCGSPIVAPRVEQVQLCDQSKHLRCAALVLTRPARV